MIRNFLVLAYRHFVRSPLTSFIELFGMTAGLTVFLLILLWVNNQLTFDKFNQHAERIYRLEKIKPDGRFDVGQPTILPSVIEDNLSEVELTCRVRLMDQKHRVYRTNPDQSKSYYHANEKVYADNSFFEMFSFEFVAGEPTTALSEKNRIVITERMAKKIFGHTDVIGKQIFDESNQMAIISGVIKDRTDFHIPFDLIYSFISLEELYLAFGRPALDEWDFPLHYVYLQVNKEVDDKTLNQKITSLVDHQRPKRFTDEEVVTPYFLRPLTDIYLNSSGAIYANYAKQGDRKMIFAYASIAIFTLILACINFINLNSAKLLERAKEVGIKKVSGASRANLFIQFLGEVGILCLISLLLALVFTHTLLPKFGELLDADLTMHTLLEPGIIALLILGLMIVSLASGGLPALYTSGLQTIRAMKGITKTSQKSVSFRKWNLIVQFALTITLLIATITVFHQINYMKDAKLGFDREYRITFPFNIETFGDKEKTLKQTLQANPNILGVTLSFATPGNNTFVDQHISNFEVNGEAFGLKWAFVDDHYFKTLNVPIKLGRDFEQGRPLDHVHSVFAPRNIILNQRAVDLMGLDEPIGKTIMWNGQVKADCHVIGVVDDFHLNSLNNPIEPMFFTWSDIRYHMMVNMSRNDIRSTVRFIEEQVELATGIIPDIQFLDSVFERQYASDEHFAQLVGYFSILAIFIAAIGLLGVSSHSIKIRIKEIGIRKSMGAASSQIFLLLIKSFTAVIVIAGVIAIPIAYLIMNRWLDNYAYRIELSWPVFLTSGVITVLIAFFTIFWQSWRASNLNPARLIRYE